MSDINIPLVPPATMTGEEEPTSVAMSKEEAVYLLHQVRFYKSVIQDFVKNVNPMDYPIITAFLQAALESQASEAAGAFDEIREFFGAVYPKVLEHERKAHPDLPADGLLIVVPTPAIQSVGVEPLSSKPRIITPGSKLVN